MSKDISIADIFDDVMADKKPPAPQPFQMPAKGSSAPVSKPAGPAKRSTGQPKTFGVSSGLVQTGQRIGIYGPGGIGKTTLAASLGAGSIKPVFIDFDKGSRNLDVSRVDGIDTWKDMTDALVQPSIWEPYGAIVLDSVTRGEGFGVVETLASVKTEKGGTAKRIEQYGYGKGYQYLYETFIELFDLLDLHTAAGRHVVLIAHECTTTVPNPNGEDFLQYQPRLQSPSSGKASIRHHMKEWLDHLFFIGYDVATDEGKGKGSGTRTIYPTERPTHWAKSRSLRKEIVFKEGSIELWKQLFGKK